MISPDVAANLNAVAPSYTEQVPAPASTTAASVSAASTASAPPSPASAAPATPRNTIYRIPAQEFRLTNSAPKVEATPRQMLSPRGELDLAYKRRPGLRYTSIPIPFLNNDGIALMMLAEDDRLERIKAMDEMLTLTRELDPAAYQKTKDAVDAAKVRSR